MKMENANGIALEKNLPIKALRISTYDYQKLILTKKIVVNFHAVWCAPCKKMEPYLLKMQQRFERQNYNYQDWMPIQTNIVDNYEI
jgi:thiol-disulfide isomerase/thioredoxin